MSSGVGLGDLIKVVVAGIVVILASIPGKDYDKRHDPGELTLDDLPARYDHVQLASFFGTRPVRVLRRQSEVVGKISAVLVAILSDWGSSRWESNMKGRASWLREVLEGLGPAYVKIGQALSTRIDVFPEPYLVELQKLQARCSFLHNIM